MPWDLDEMADMAETEPVRRDRAGAGHIDGDKPINSSRFDSGEGRRIAAELFGHREDGQLKPFCLRRDNASVAANRIEI
jgi:hypothetical protein